MFLSSWPHRNSIQDFLYPEGSTTNKSSTQQLLYRKLHLYSRGMTITGTTKSTNRNGIREWHRLYTSTRLGLGAWWRVTTRRKRKGKCIRRVGTNKWANDYSRKSQCLTRWRSWNKWKAIISRKRNVKRLWIMSSSRIAHPKTCKRFCL